ncbi:MAG: hypothetical protein ACE5K8_03980 [Candidatus Zixiibacteriota bacterium]
MFHEEQDLSHLPNDLSMLDDLIRRCYRELLKIVEQNPKLGDFLKMIELRRKLAPSDADQKEFWKMLEQIRQEELQTNNLKSPRKKKKTATK